MNKEVKKAFDGEELLNALKAMGLNVKSEKGGEWKEPIPELLEKIRSINERLQKM